MYFTEEKAKHLAEVNGRDDSWNYKAVPVVGNKKGLWRVEVSDENGRFLGNLGDN